MTGSFIPDMSKEQMVQLHDLLSDYEIYLATHVQNDRDGGMVEYVKKIIDHIEQTVATL